MHPSSFDKMAVFRRDYLESRLDEALVILDLGSQGHQWFLPLAV
jgi:hypothetical protein